MGRGNDWSGKGRAVFRVVFGGISALFGRLFSCTESDIHDEDVRFAQVQSQRQPDSAHTQHRIASRKLISGDWAHGADQF